MSVARRKRDIPECVKRERNKNEEKSKRGELIIFTLQHILGLSNEKKNMGWVGKVARMKAEKRVRTFDEGAQEMYILFKKIKCSCILTLRRD